MTVVTDADEMRGWSDRLRRDGRTIGLVPTMGALHDGHLALIREAWRRSDAVIVTVFVNPTQFGPGEDFRRYPRPLESDLDRLRDDSVTDHERYFFELARRARLRLGKSGVSR